MLSYVMQRSKQFLKATCPEGRHSILHCIKLLAVKVPLYDHAIEKVHHFLIPFIKKKKSLSLFVSAS